MFVEGVFMATVTSVLTPYFFPWEGRGDWGEEN